MEDSRMSEQTTERTCRKTYKEKLRPTPTQERALECVLWHCRTLYNTALEQHITAWQRCHVSVTRYQQKAELKDIRVEFPEYAAIHSHVLQDVLARLDTTYQAFTFKEYGNGARSWTAPETRCPRSGVSRCAGRVRWKAPSRRSP